MSKKASSTALLSGLLVAGSILGMTQTAAKADSVADKEGTASTPAPTATANNIVTVPATAIVAQPMVSQTAGANSQVNQATASSVADSATVVSESSQLVTESYASSETAASEPETSESITSSATVSVSERYSTAEVTPVTTVEEQNVSNDAYLTDPETTKASYTKDDGDIHYSVVVSNPTSEEKTMTVHLTVQQAADVIGQDGVQLTLGAGSSAKVSNLTVASDWLENNTGYLVTVSVADQEGRLLSSKRAGLSVEKDWTVFPRYGIVAGSPTDQNSILVKNLEAYRNELELMKSMNINSYFFYDAYAEATDPFPEGVDSFVQKWNTWSHTQVDTAAVKALVDEVHQSGAVAMLYNMISADSNPSNPALPLAALAYNFYDSFGKKGDPMTYTIGEHPTQVYYDPANPDWQKYIAGVMKSAMDRMGFDGWQGDTIGDNRVVDYAHRLSTDEADSHMMSDSYASFINAMKDLIGEDYYITINDVNGGNDDKLKDARQDVIYNELWTNGGSVISGRMQTTYGDLKARVDLVRQKTGKSLVVGAYMEGPGIDYTIPGGKATNGAGADALAGKPLQADATLLVDATIAAAGGYHMSIAALANANAALNVLQSAYYPTQYLSVAKDTIRKLYNYQQFITAYENLLRGEGVSNTDNAVSTQTSQGKLLSKDELGVSGDQVWTFAKSGKGFSTIHLINMMGINAGWVNEEGYADNKTPDTQTNLVVRYSLAGKTVEEARNIATQVYVTSPDDWSTSHLQKVTATVETDANGQPVLVISVPQLVLWDMIYIKEDTSATPAQPTILKPVDQTKPTSDRPQTSETSTDTTSETSESVASTSTVTQETSGSVQVSTATSTSEVSSVISEIVSQSTTITTSITLTKPASQEAVTTALPQASQTSETSITSEALSTASQAAASQSEVLLSETSVQVSLSQRPTVSELPSETPSRPSEHSASVDSSSETAQSVGSVLSETSHQASSSETSASTSQIASVTSESVTSQAISDSHLSSELMTSEVVTSEMLQSVLNLDSTVTMTEVTSLFSQFAVLSETASSEHTTHSMAERVLSEVSEENLAVSIASATGGAPLASDMTRMISDLVNNISAEVNYVVTNSQELVNILSGNTYQGSKELTLAPKEDKTENSTTAMSQQVERADKIAKKTQKWNLGDRAIAIATAIILAGVAAAVALRNFLTAKESK